MIKEVYGKIPLLPFFNPEPLKSGFDPQHFDQQGKKLNQKVLCSQNQIRIVEKRDNQKFLISEWLINH